MERNSVSDDSGLIPETGRPHPSPRLQVTAGHWGSRGAATGLGGRDAMRRVPSQRELLPQEQAGTFSEWSCCSGGCATAKGALGQASHVLCEKFRLLNEQFGHLVSSHVTVEAVG